MLRHAVPIRSRGRSAGRHACGGFHAGWPFGLICALLVFWRDIAPAPGCSSGSGDVLHAFIYTDIAILVRHWFEVSLRDSHLEHGARLELRLRVPQPSRGTESAAQRIVVDQPLWRADLFDRVDGTPGAFEAAHFHPCFTGVEPCKRNWADPIKATPWEWLHEQLSDIVAVAETGGIRFPAWRRTPSRCEPTPRRSSRWRRAARGRDAVPRSSVTPGPGMPRRWSTSC